MSSLVGTTALLTTCGGAQIVRGNNHVCFAETKTSLKDTEVRSFWPEDWFDLLFHGFDRYSKIPKHRPQVCTEKLLTWPRPKQCLVHEPRPTVLERTPISEKDLVFSPVGKDRRLVWAIVRRYDNGEAAGAVAITEFTPHGVAVHTIGTLRAPGQRVRMELKRTDEGRVLLVEGQLCAEDSDTACPRFVRALLVRGRQFMPVPLTNKAGECQGPAYFPLSRSATKSLEGGFERRYVMNSTVSVKRSGIIVHEQLTVHDINLSQPETAPQLRRSAEIERLVRVVGGRLIPESASLWHRVEVETGTVPTMSSDKKGDSLLAPSVL